MKKIAGLLALPLLLAGLVAPLSAAAQTPAPSTPQPGATPVGKTTTVVVALENGTPGGKLPSEVALTLYAIGPEGPVYTKEAKSDAEGRARFTDLDYQAGWRFGVLGRVGASTYFSQMIAPEPGVTEPGAPASGEPELRLPLRVYETTTDNSRLRISQAYVAAEVVAKGQLRVTSMYVLANHGDRTIEGSAPPGGGQPETLHFPLPRDAQNVQFEQDDGSRYARTEDGFVTRDGVPPGDQGSRLVVRYTVPYFDALRLDSTLAYPIDSLAIYVTTQGITFTNSLFTGSESQAGENGGTVAVWTAEKIAAGQPLALEFSGKAQLPPPLPPVADQPSTEGLAGLTRGLTTKELAGFGLIALGLLAGLIAAGAWLYGSLQRPDLVRTQERDIVRALADLQEDRGAGRIEPADCEQRRRRLVAALSTLTASTTPVQE